MKLLFIKAKDTAFLVLVCVSIGLNSFKISAQTFGLSVSVGAIFSQIDGDGTSGYNRLNPHIGLRSIIPAGNRLQIKTGIFYNERGSLSEFLNYSRSAINTRIQLAEIPLELHWQDWADDNGQYRMNYFFGFSYGRVLDVSIASTNMSLPNEGFNPNNFSYLIGAEISIFNQWKIGGRFTRSISLFYNSRNFPGTNFRSMQTYFLSLYLVYDLF